MAQHNYLWIVNRFLSEFLAIPSTSDAAEGTQSGVSARISVGIQSVIKLFYRPSGLSMPASEAAKKLTFSNTEHGLGISNPTPYYVTLSRLNVDGKSMDVKGTEAGAMLAPFSTQYYPVNGTVRTVSGQPLMISVVKVSNINRP